ncbi:putative reverse transcriptase domain-containing protein [Tanacetum coccineum]
MCIAIHFHRRHAEYGVSTSIGYNVSSSQSNTAYSLKSINMAYPLPLDTTYRLSRTEAEILTLSLDELRWPDFNLLSDQEYSDEEEAKAMAETMEEYMSKTRADYRSGVVRPKIKEKDSFELKGQFLKELRSNTFSDQVMLKAFPMSLTGAASRWLRNKPTEPDENLYQAWEQFKELLMKCPQHYLTEIQEVVLFYNGLDVPTRPILDSRGVIPSKTVADAKVDIQEMVEYSQKWHNGTSRARSTKTSDGLAAIQAQLNNLEREIKKVNEKVYAAQVGCEQCKGPHYTKDCILKEGKTLKEAYYTKETRRKFQFDQRNLSYDRCCHKEPRSIDQNFRDTNRENEQADSHPIRRIGSPQYVVSTGQNRTSVSVMPLLTYLNLGLGELAYIRLTVKLADRTVKYPKGIAKNVLVGIGKFTFLIDFIILDMPEDIKVPLILEIPFLSIARSKINVYKRKITLRSLDHFLEDYIELNDLNEQIELRRNQRDDLMPTIKEGEVIEEFRTNDEDLDTGIDDYPSYCDNDKKIYINYAHNLRMKDKMVYKGNNVVGAVMNVSIFVGTFSVVTDFVVLENMDAYRDQGIGNVIVDEPFLREVGIKAKRFEWIITLYKNDDEATYQMVSEKDEKNGISHAYKKLKGFYKGVLNLGPEYI